MAYISCRFYSKYLAHQTEVGVLMPDLYGREPKDNYPVLYLLHGRGDDCMSYIRNSCIERYADEHQIAVIMPSAETSFYKDGIYGKRFFSYITKELPGIMRAWLPVSEDPEDTFIAGLSMGGYGALKIGLSFPERFKGIGIMSAGVRPDRMPDFAPTDEENDILHENLQLAFGTGEISEDDIPEMLIRNLISKGSAIPFIRHYEGKQDMIYDMNRDFREFAESTDLDYRYEEWDGGHDWIFWDTALKKMLDEFFGR